MNATEGSSAYASEPLIAMDAPVTRLFLIQQPALEELSSPQLDVVFDVMSFLYRSIPGMELMAELRAQGIQSPRG